MQPAVKPLELIETENESHLVDRRVHFRGIVLVNCPYCGSINQRRVQKPTWKIRCQYRGCRRVLAWCLFTMPIGEPSHGSMVPQASVPVLLDAT